MPGEDDSRHVCTRQLVAFRHTLTHPSDYFGLTDRASRLALGLVLWLNLQHGLSRSASNTTLKIMRLIVRVLVPASRDYLNHAAAELPQDV